VILDGSTTVSKILLTSWVVKGEIVSPNFPHSPAKIADFGLKYGILKKNAINSISGSNIAHVSPNNSEERKEIDRTLS
jgi:hypothetical protein